MKPILRAVLTGVILVGGIVVLIVGVIKFDEWGKERNRDKVAHLESRLDEFLAIATRNPGSSSSERSSRAVKAKPVFVCVRSNDNDDAFGIRFDRKIDALTNKLPDDLFPDSADEVNTVVALSWGQNPIGSYDDGSSAYQETCTVEIYDSGSGQLVASKTFTGGQPPEFFDKVEGSSARHDVFGSRCDEDILKYVTSLFK
jgi:hypothetical protein